MLHNTPELLRGPDVVDSWRARQQTLSPLQGTTSKAMYACVLSVFYNRKTAKSATR